MPQMNTPRTAFGIGYDKFNGAGETPALVSVEYERGQVWVRSVTRFGWQSYMLSHAAAYLANQITFSSPGIVMTEASNEMFVEQICKEIDAQGGEECLKQRLHRCHMAASLRFEGRKMVMNQAIGLTIGTLFERDLLRTEGTGITHTGILPWDQDTSLKTALGMACVGLHSLLWDTPNEMRISPREAVNA